MLGCQPFQMRLRGQLPHTSPRSARHLAPLSKTSRSQQRFQPEQYVPDWMSGVLCSRRDFPVRWRGPRMRTWVENQSLPCLHRGIRRDWISRRAAAGDAPRGSLRSDQQPPFSPRVLPSFLVHQASLGCSLQPQPSRRYSQSHWLRPATLLEEKQKPILSWFFFVSLGSTLLFVCPRTCYLWRRWLCLHAVTVFCICADCPGRTVRPSVCSLNIDLHKEIVFTVLSTIAQGWEKGWCREGNKSV